jgi:Flp pilus assembly protein TadG
MTTMPEPRTAPIPAPPVAPQRSPNGLRGQAMVEFAAVLLPLLVIVVGIVQFGLLFGANVSLTNAAREAARQASIYRYIGADTSNDNGIDRCTSAVNAATQAFGFLSNSSPHFSASAPCPGGVDLNGDGLHDLWQNGDVEISFCASGTAPGTDCPRTASPTNYCTVDSGEGCLVRVKLTYNQSIVVPLLDAILDGDGNGLFELSADASMVMN